MKLVDVHAVCRITKGMLKDCIGMVVEYDKTLNKVSVKVDEFTTVVLSSEHIYQELENVEKSCSCGIIYSIYKAQDDGHNSCHHCSANF